MGLFSFTKKKPTSSADRTPSIAYAAVAAASADYNLPFSSLPLDTQSLYIFNASMKQCIGHVLGENCVIDFGLRPIYASDYFITYRPSSFSHNQATSFDAVAFAYFIARFLCVTTNVSLDIKNKFSFESMKWLYNGFSKYYSYPFPSTQSYFRDRFSLYESALDYQAKQLSGMLSPVINLFINFLMTDVVVEKPTLFSSYPFPVFSALDRVDYSNWADDYLGYVIDSFDANIKQVWHDFFGLHP